MGKKRKRLGEVLAESGLVSASDVESAALALPETGRRLGEELVSRGLLTPTRIAQALSFQLSIPWVSLAKIVPERSLLRLLTAEDAERLLLVPVYERKWKRERTLYVAMADPTHEGSLSACESLVHMPVRPLVATPEDVHAAVRAWYFGEAPMPAPEPEEPSGATKVTLSLAPRSSGPTSEGKIEASEIEVVPSEKPKPVHTVPAPPPPPNVRGDTPEAVVLVVSAPESFVRECEAAALSLGAHIVATDLREGPELARKVKPLALVITEDVYAFDRLSFNKLAFEAGAPLVVWSEDLEANYLEALLSAAMMRKT